MNTSRRTFIKSATVAVAGLTSGFAAETGAQRRNTRLGLDNFSVRAMGWKAPALIDYAASLKTDSLFISDLDAFESFEEKYLHDLKSRAADKGLRIHVGTWSICPTSKSFRNKWGTADEHLALAIRVAKAVGSPVLRVILGNGDDRK